MIIDIYYGVNDVRVFVLFSPASYEGECGIVYGVFSSKEEAEKYKSHFLGDEIQEHTIDEYNNNVEVHY